MARRVRFSSRGGRPGFRPATEWLAALATGTLTADVGGNDADAFDLTGTLADPHEDPKTILRVHLEWFMTFQVLPGTAAGIRFVGVGLGVESPNALLGGVATLPVPITDMGWDGWMAHKVFPALILPAGTGPQSTTRHVWSIDGKAMRRLEDNELFLAVELQTDSGELDEAAYAVSVRWLWQDSAKR